MHHTIVNQAVSKFIYTGYKLMNYDSRNKMQLPRNKNKTLFLLLLKTILICICHFLWKQLSFIIKNLRIWIHKHKSSRDFYFWLSECSLLRKLVVHSYAEDFRNILRPRSCYRSSLLQIFYKISVLKNSVKLIEKWMCLSLIFIKVFIKKETPTQIFSHEFCKHFEKSSFRE